MNLLRAANSVPLAARDIAPLTGTPQWATDGNPAASPPVPQTVWPAYAWNMISAELAAIVTAAGLALDDTNWSQVLAAQKILFAQTGLVGAARNLKASVAAASSSATFTADQIIVGTALNGLLAVLPSFSETVNLATVGANGMDAGSPTASGFTAVYAIWNPATGAQALLATDATTAAASAVYGGAHMPAGYTYSALISVWRMDPTGKFVVGLQNDRHIALPSITAISTTVQVSVLTSLSVASAVPLNARTVDFINNLGTNGAGSCASFVCSTASGLNQQYNQFGMTVNGQIVQNGHVDIATPQTIFYLWNIVTNTGTFNIYVTGYSF